MTVATTRPETMLGDTAVAVHSEDPRWNWAIGKYVELPLTGPTHPHHRRRHPRRSEIRHRRGEGDARPRSQRLRRLATPQGQADEIEIINILNPDGNDQRQRRPAYAGMKRDAARKKVVEDLRRGPA